MADESIEEIVDRVRSEIEWLISDRPTELEWELRDRGKPPPYPPEFWKGLEKALAGLQAALEALDETREQ